jgi:uncharacterized protein (TIGR04255 family)
MSESELKLAKPPIVEAVLDIDCDMPPGFDLIALEGPARNAFRSQYPKFRNQFLEEHHIESKADELKHSSRRAVQALQFLKDDEKQLVQARRQGFSFNRLAPYSSLDDYLSEIQRTWEIFTVISFPVQIRVVRLRYINRILLPFVGGPIDLENYLKAGPRMQGEDKLRLTGFVNQQTALELGTEYQANIVLASQPPENDKLPIILDICVASAKSAEPKDWPLILGEIQSLRSLKNRIFKNTLTPLCLNLFQQ